eukprot:3248025-Amphidinium_carterae.1
MESSRLMPCGCKAISLVEQEIQDGCLESKWQWCGKGLIPNPTLEPFEERSKFIMNPAIPIQKKQ